MVILAHCPTDAAQMDHYVSAYVYVDGYLKVHETWFMIHGTDHSSPITDAMGGYQLCWSDTAL
jgi:hypothetical protein